MKYCFKGILLLLGIGATTFAQQPVNPAPVEPGVSLTLSTYRHSVISNISYILDFDIPAGKGDNIPATANIRFNLSANRQPLQLDFKQDPDHIKTLSVNGKNVTVDLRNEHIIIDPLYLRTGINKIGLQFVAGDASLNRNADYLYALFVPDRARTVFPCFDQPDLKARFLLTLRVPTGWKVLANGIEKDTVVNGVQTIHHFANSDLLPTYLFSFTAGKYKDIKRKIGNRDAELLYREEDLDRNVDSIFKLHGDAISFLEQWTGIPFPFQKIGFAAIPDFQFNGMEHPGEVQYRASTLFLNSPTKDQLLVRANVISHETAHMWFGDMVTMKWFNDVWMKEVFANFMADKVSEKLMGSEIFNLKFLQDHYPRAYGIDRTPGANPIRQQLDNLKNAGSMYGDIIYHKAPIMMRQIELLMGKENFRKGVQEYLKKYAYNNATWDDLIAILSKYSKTDLYKWNKVWTNQPGRPVFDYTVDYSQGKIHHFKITQHPETGEARIWPQVFNITLVYPDNNKTIRVNMDHPEIELKDVEGLPKPPYILFNADGIGYGLFPADAALTERLFSLESPLKRASAYINTYENMLAGRCFKPNELLTLFTRGLTTEKEETNLKLLTSYITTLYWEFTLPKDRPAFTAILEDSLWSAMEQQPLPNNKKVLFKAYQDVYLSAAAGKRMYEIWEQQRPPEGIKLSEDDFISLALSIALKSDTVTSVLKQQLARVKDVDRKERLAFLMPALSINGQERDDFFNSLKDRKNRGKEAWVLTALAYLHHPLRQNTSARYLPESLQLVEEIQRTGDIFFPQSWLSVIFGTYQSKEAWQVVSDFLSSHPDYNPTLKDKILQSTDNLHRAQKLLHL